MFVWPQVVRLSEGRPLPQLHLRTDADGWASMATENFWRNLPGPIITVVTFGVCGFLIVYVLGSRGFCTYGCPYGTVFRLADRVAPAKIRLRGNDCLQCGTCTAACTSHVRVHEELNRYGMVVNPACLKDLDCVAACPKGNVFYGFGRPSLFKTIRNDTAVRKTYDFTGWEEAVLFLVFLVVLFIFRGLYDQIPFLLSIALGTIVAYLAVVFLRMAYRPALQLNRWQLKLNGRLTTSGCLFASAMVLFGLITAHSALVHYHAFQGHRLAVQALALNVFDEPTAREAVDHLNAAQQWGLIPTTRIPTALADLHYQLAGLCFKSARTQEAEEHLRAALSAGPTHFMAHYDLGVLLLEKGQRAPAVEHLRRATALKPDFAEGHYNLALAHWMLGTYDEARREINAAFELNPADEQTRRLHGLMHDGS
jgi:tetratricopeptide (TPR) repeat protein